MASVAPICAPADKTPKPKTGPNQCVLARKVKDAISAPAKVKITAIPHAGSLISGSRILFCELELWICGDFERGKDFGGLFSYETLEKSMMAVTQTASGL
jgi:hypothetical protein